MNGACVDAIAREAAGVAAGVTTSDVSRVPAISWAILAVGVLALTAFGVATTWLYSSRRRQQRNMEFNVEESPAATSPMCKIPHPTPLAMSMERYSQI